MADVERLFTAFPPVSTEEWNRQIRDDLASVDPDELLSWVSPDDMIFRAFYRQEDLIEIPWLDADPGSFPFIRGSRNSAPHWLIREDFIVRNAHESREAALDSIENGSDSIGFSFPGGSSGLSSLLDSLPLDKIAVNLEAGSRTAGLYGKLMGLARKFRTEPGQIRGSLEYDPVTEFCATGNSREKIDAWLNDLKGLAGPAGEHPGFRMITVRGNRYHNIGATTLQELAFSLAAGCEYLSGLTDTGFDAGRVLPLMQFHFAVGTSYFLEIAKLRAARLLWSYIAHAFGAKEDDCRTFIHCDTSLQTQTVYDPHINILRGTTQAMSAVIGGTDSLSIRPFDHAYQTGTGFSRRISRNIQLILKEESGFDRVSDPGGGSYYIEKLTQDLAGRAWDLFLEIEGKGGIIELAASGIIGEMMREAAGKRAGRIACGKEILLGTNAYPVPGERKPDGINQEVYDSMKELRQAAAFEALRMKTESLVPVPTAFMFTYGDAGKRRSRANFSCNFFACGGFRVIDNPGFGTLEEGLAALAEHQAGIVVLCSSDDEYPAMAMGLSKKLKKGTIPVIAGRPGKHAGEIRKAGISHFIHSGSDLLEELKKYLELSIAS